MIQITVNDINLVAKAHYDRICNDHGKATGLHSILQKKSTDFTIFKNHQRFYAQLLNDLQFNGGKNLISGPPDYLKERIDYYNLNFPKVLSKRFRNTLLNKVFFYSNYNKWGAYELAKRLSVNVCPYCNRQYTFTVDGEIKGRTRPQYDHFYSKKDYPFLSLSFYNLIPSCSICNADLKGQMKFCITKNMHPYLEGFGNDLLFSIVPKNIQFINGKASSYRIKFKAGPNSDQNKVKRALRNVVAFKLSQLYNFHKDYVDEIIIKSRIYNKEYIETLYKQFQGDLFSDINDVKRLITSNYTDEKDFGKRPLAKITSDISNELGLFN